MRSDDRGLKLTHYPLAPALALRIEERRGLPLGALLAGVAVLAIAAVGLLHLDSLPLPVCLFKLGTGFPCMTCGATRALGRLFARDLPGAFAMNPLATLGTLALAPWALADLLLALRGRALALTLPPRLRAVLAVIAVAALLANWVYLVLAGR